VNDTQAGRKNSDQEEGQRPAEDLSPTRQDHGQNFTVTRRADVAKFFDVSVHTVDVWIGSGMPGTETTTTCTRSSFGCEVKARGGRWAATVARLRIW